MRKPRILRPDAHYHVTARITRKEMVFKAEEARELFFETVKRAKKKYDFRIENFCVMGNHFHFLIKPGTGMSLSRIMQWIMSVFARRFNKIHGQWGPVWGSRYFSRIMETLRDFIKTFEYICQNPVLAKLVDYPEDWLPCGLRHIRDGCTEIMEPLEDWIQRFFPKYQPLRLM